MPHSDPGSHYAVSSGYSSSGYSSSSASSSAASSAGYNSGYNSSASSATSSPTSDGDRLQRAFTTAAVAQRRPKMPQRNTSWSLMPQSERRSAPPLGRVKSKLKGGTSLIRRKSEALAKSLRIKQPERANTWDAAGRKLSW